MVRPHAALLIYTVFGLFLSDVPRLGAQDKKAPISQPTPEAAAEAARPDPAKSALLQQLSGSLEGVTSKTGRAVVQIFARSYVPAQGGSEGDQLLTSQNSSGSGVILSPDGYILTNAHVVSGARTLRVQLADLSEQKTEETQLQHLGRSVTAKVIGIDQNTDLAVIKIDRANLPFLSLGDSAQLKQGQIVLALGNPLGLENSVSMGVISAVSRQLKPDDFMAYIQTDAPINPGNSGGPLVDTEGRVIGIDTLILTQSGGSEGIGFAIPSNVAKLVFNQIRKYGHVHRTQLGIMAEAISPAMADGLELPVDHGIIVSDVSKGSPADHAGLQADDIILSVNGRRIATPRQLELSLYRQEEGSRVALDVQRGEQKLNLFAVPEARNDPLEALADITDPAQNMIQQLSIIGLDITPKVAELIDGLRRPAGVLVAASTPNRPSSASGLKTGDVIFSVNRKVINSLGELRTVMAPFKSGDPAVVLIQRNQQLMYVAMEID